MSRNTTLILDRLDEINVTISRLSSTPGARLVPVRVPRVAAREVIESRLRARGVPSSTTQQVNAVLDELDAGR